MGFQLTGLESVLLVPLGRVKNESERLKKKIQDSADKTGVNVDESLHQDLCEKEKK